MPLFRNSSTRVNNSDVVDTPPAPRTNSSDKSPFFARKPATDASTTPASNNNGSTSLWRRKSVANENAVPVTEEKRGLFGGPKRQSTDLSRNSASGVAGVKKGTAGHLFSKHDSLTAARTKLDIAIKAEKLADEALLKSRAAVKEAKVEAHRLEKEAIAEQKAADIKVKQAKVITKAGDKLGRH